MFKDKANVQLATIRFIAQQLYKPQNISNEKILQFEKNLRTLPLSSGFHSWAAQIYLNHNIDISDWPQEVQTQYLNNEFRTTYLEHELESLLQIFEQNHYEYCLLKGIWLIKNILPAKGLRVFGDVDIWVSDDIYCKIESAMSELGFYRRDKLHYLFHFHKEFRKPLFSSEIIFEIHKSLSLNDFYKFDHEQIWLSAKRTPHTSEIGLQVEHQIIYSFCHSAVHGFDRPSRLMDLPVLYRWAMANSLDKEKLMSTLTDWRCRKLFLFSLIALEWLLEDQFGSLLFENKERESVQEQFSIWLRSFAVGEVNSRHIRRIKLTDSTWRACCGIIHPKRIMGALVDRLGIY